MDTPTKRPAEVLTGFAGAVLVLLVAFDVPLTTEQCAAIGGVISGLPFAITALVETFRSFRRDHELKVTLDRVK